MERGAWEGESDGTTDGVTDTTLGDRVVVEVGTSEEVWVGTSEGDWVGTREGIKEEGTEDTGMILVARVGTLEEGGFVGIADGTSEGKIGLALGIVVVVVLIGCEEVGEEEEGTRVERNVGTLVCLGTKVGSEEGVTVDLTVGPDVCALVGRIVLLLVGTIEEIGEVEG